MLRGALAAAVAACWLSFGIAADDKPAVKGGIEGKIKSVDAEKDTLTIVGDDGKVQTFTVKEETTIVGPRGGVVHRRMKDPRFHDGLDITVVASGTTAKEIHLGYDRSGGEAEKKPATTKAKTTKSKAPVKKEASAKKEAPLKTGTPTKAGDEDDDATDFPGKLKTADADKRLLVVTMLNGKDQSYFVSSALKVTVKGVASKKGLADPALKAGVPVVVVTEGGPKKVKELKVLPEAAGKAPAKTAPKKAPPAGTAPKAPAKGATAPTPPSKSVTN